MSDWLEKLRLGTISCRVVYNNVLIQEFNPTDAGQLWASILIRNLGETVKSYFDFEYEQFVASGKAEACYECEACKTIEKCGGSIQFKETFLVEFEDTSKRATTSDECTVIR